MTTWKIVTGLVLVALIAWTVRLQLRGEINPSLSPATVRMQCTNQTCGKISTVKLRSATDLVCRHCSARLVPISVCPHCQTELVLKSDLGQPEQTACPTCGKEVRRED